LVLWTTNYKFLPETLQLDARQPFEVRHLMHGYWQLGSSPRFLLLALASLLVLAVATTNGKFGFGQHSYPLKARFTNLGQQGARTNGIPRRPAERAPAGRDVVCVLRATAGAFTRFG